MTCDELIWCGRDGWAVCTRPAVGQIHFRYGSPKLVCKVHQEEHERRKQELPNKGDGKEKG